MHGLEATRQTQAGYVTPDRTFVISPTHRVFTIQEKIAMGDGRADADRMKSLIERFARGAAINDFAALAQKAGCQLNAVLLGLAARQLPVSPDAFRNAIRSDGRAVEANLRGFEAGFAYADQQIAPVPQAEPAPIAAAPVPEAFAGEIDRLPNAARVRARRRCKAHRFSG